MRLLLIVVGLITVCLAGRAVRADNVKSIPDLKFAEPDGIPLQLDLLVPEDISKPPLVIYIHGGAWTNGDRKKPPFDWLTKHGFAVASISYRFSAQATYPAQIHDCKAAVRWLRAHAAEYGYDASRIGVIGASAGGHLAVLLGTTAGNAELEGTVGGNTDQSSKVDAVIDYYGPTDFILRAKNQPQMTDPPGSRVYKLLGGAPKDREALAKLASGAWQMSPGDSPFLIFHGGSDTTVLPDQSERLFRAAQEAKVPSALYIVPSGTHSLEAFRTDENRKLVVDFLDKYLKQPPGHGSTAPTLR